jgi:GWxTD domain-containing protein
MRVRYRSLLALLSLFLGVSLVSARAQDHPAAGDQAPLTYDGKPYQKWLDEDVRYIITDQDRSDFSKLTTDKQRDEFVETFWDRRNPTPQSSRNPYKEVHYQRLAYANTHFAAAVPGFRTDRGRFYIMYGPPDSVDSKSGSAPPIETWHYMFIEGIGKNVVLTFTDSCACGKYQLSGTNSDSRAPQIFDPLRQ